MSQEKSTISKIWGVVSTVLVILVVLVAVFLMGSRILGFRVFNVISGSMEPTYSVGDLVYVKEVPAEEIKTNLETRKAVKLIVDSAVAVAPKKPAAKKPAAKKSTTAKKTTTKKTAKPADEKPAEETVAEEKASEE